MGALLWLRRDLRVHDHPALRAAIDAGGDVTPVFCLDDALLHGRHASGSRTQFMLECLADLDRSLRDRGSRLLVRHGAPQRELPSLARRAGATSVHFSADAGPFARRREAQVAEALNGAGVRAVAHPGLFVADELHSIRTGAGRPYTVFGPFERKWLAQPRRRVTGAPRALAAPGGTGRSGKIPELSKLGLESECNDPLPGGERAARAALRRFIAGPVKSYAQDRDRLGGGVSRLSPYLHFGCISPREIEQRLEGGGRGPPPSYASCAGATSTRTCSRTSHRTRAANTNPGFAARSAGATLRSASAPGALVRPGIRWSTRGCASCDARGGCTIAHG